MRERGGCVVLVGVTVLLAGCGGMEQDDLRQYAIRRDAEEVVAETGASTAAPTTSLQKIEPTTSPQKMEPSVSVVSDDSASGRGPTSTAVEAGQPHAEATSGTLARARQGPAPEISAPSVATPNSPAAAPTEASTAMTPGNAPAQSTDARSVSPAERLELSRRKLETIAAAMQAYVAEQGAFPPAAIRGPNGTQLLSWRVALLPYLGHEELYQQFQLDQPWDSPHNRALLAQIPDVYRSPERTDERTRYQVPLGSSTIFSRPRGIAPRNVEDGLSETILLVEVEDSLAVPWTEPVDFEYAPNDPLRGLAQARPAGFLAAWCDGTVELVPGNCPPLVLRSLLTIDGGESHLRNQLAATEPAPVSTPEGAETPPPASSAANASPAPSTSTWPIPDSLAQDRARKIFYELYHAEYELARTPQARQQLARKLLTSCTEIQEDPASLYVLLSIIQQIATDAGDPSSAFEAHDRLAKRFNINAHQQQVQLLRELLPKLPRGQRAPLVQERAAKLANEAAAKQAWSEAIELCQIALSLARAARQGQQVAELTLCLQQLQDAQQAERAADEAFKTLEQSPEDPRANDLLGRYLCFYKRDWQNGLPLLARSPQALLRELARAELSQAPRSLQEQVELGDRWWDLAETASAGEQLAMRQRAGHWYAGSIDEVPPGLLRVKLERRLAALNAPQAR